MIKLLEADFPNNLRDLILAFAVGYIVVSIVVAVAFGWFDRAGRRTKVSR